MGSLAAVGYLLSVFRDALLAMYYGGSPALDVYFIGLSPAQFIGTEAASLVYLAFLPEFVRAAQTSDISGYGDLFRERLAFSGKSGLLLAAFLAIVGAAVPQLFAPGYAEHNVLRLLRTCLVVLSALIPGLAFVGVMRASLEARAHFSPWALLPGFRSATMIICVLLSASHPAIGWLLAGSLLGVVLAIGYATLVGRDHSHFMSRLDGRARGPAIPLPPSLAPLVGTILLGAVATMVDNAFASKAGVGGAQALALALNLLAAPQNIIGGVVATVFFPLYGRFWLGDQRRAASASLWRSIRLVVYGLLPVVLLLTTAGIAVVRIVYKHGVFTEDLAILVSETVTALAVGQVFFASMVLLRQFLLVAGAPWAVCEGAAVYLCVKWLGNLVLIGPFGLPGVALASSLAALVTCAFLAIRVLRVLRTSARA